MARDRSGYLHPHQRRARLLRARNKRYGCKICRDFKELKCKPQNEDEGPCKYASVLDQYDSYDAYDEALMRDCVSMLLKIPTN